MHTTGEQPPCTAMETQRSQKNERKKYKEDPPGFLPYVGHVSLWLTSLILQFTIFWDFAI